MSSECGGHAVRVGDTARWREVQDAPSEGSCASYQSVGRHIIVCCDAGAAIEILTPTLRPPVKQYYGLKDAEVRYSMRHTDLAVNPSSFQTLATRFQLIRSMRDAMQDRGFIEVSTPVLHSVACGAAAKPFTTHHDALDTTQFLRIAPELYLKVAVGVEDGGVTPAATPCGGVRPRLRDRASVQERRSACQG